MSRWMPRSNLPADETYAGDVSGGFPYIAGLRNDEWQVYFNDFFGPTAGTGDEAYANAIDIAAEWIATDVGTNTDVADITTGGGHSLMVVPTDITDAEGLNIQHTQFNVQAIAGRTILFEALVGVEDVDAAGVFIGINEVNTAVIGADEVVDLDNGAGFRLSSTEATGTWACVQAGSTGDIVDNGDAGTSTDATITSGSNANFSRLGIKLEGVTPSITWYFDGVAVQTATATIFDAASSISFGIVGDGAVETLYVDYVMLAQTRG